VVRSRKEQPQPTTNSVAKDRSLLQHKSADHLCGPVTQEQ
jgi:hypothetical protein